MAKNRRQAREAALKALYQIEVGKIRLAPAIADMAENADLSPDLRKFAEEVVTGFFMHQAELDDRIASLVQEWDFERIAHVDRNVLRIAAFELFYRPEIPPLVTINEAIEIAKKYSTAESGRFVNGVLARLAEDSPKAEWDPSSVVVEPEEPAPKEEDVPVETITEESPEIEELAKVGFWKIRKTE